jgi:DNA-directed RNA polymerase specialized sigma24 family protein
MAALLEELVPMIDELVAINATGSLVRSTVEREEVQSKVVLELGSVLELFDGRATLQGFVKVVVIRLIRRRFYRRQEELTGVHVPTKRERERDERVDQERSERKQLYWEFEPFLDRLSPKRRSFVRLYYRFALTEEGVERGMDLDGAAVRKLKQRVLEQLDQLRAEAKRGILDVETKK